MPPRRRPPPPPPPAAPTKKSNASKAAEALGLDAGEEAEIQEAWEMFMDADGSEEVGEPVVITADVRRVMMALGFDSSKEEMKEILEVLDPENEGFVTYGMFLEVAALKMKNRDQKLEVQRAFDLFKGGTGDDSPITMADLRRVADELKENVTDQQLRDMLDEACSKEVGRGVNLKDFEAVMKRAGVL
ncbi:uncharacterized protein H6S33_005879 [Morchella sextelata]|uniref:uncharacterized protein n=1 Tax=Morchella sextelata TaxID=1174677 RepID=UPI001D052FED|nr:uncharacterized protein H6S33_005879 [Morchella sextelata]KAH0613993.1 hypothetical protein H6S33_005879 [Morchella sextelata]